MEYHYEFTEIEQGAIGGITFSPSREQFNSLKCVMYADQAPTTGDKMKFENVLYECVLDVDVTDDEEREQGLSYTMVEFYKID